MELEKKTEIINIIKKKITALGVKGGLVNRPAPMDRMGWEVGYLPLIVPLASAHGFSVSRYRALHMVFQTSDFITQGLAE
jgi:hypothetical protein